MANGKLSKTMVPAEIPLEMLKLLDTLKAQMDTQIEQVKEEMIATIEIMNDKKLLKEILTAKKQVKSGKGLTWKEFKSKRAE